VCGSEHRCTAPIPYCKGADGCVPLVHRCGGPTKFVDMRPTRPLGNVRIRAETLFALVVTPPSPVADGDPIRVTRAIFNGTRIRCPTSLLVERSNATRTPVVSARTSAGAGRWSTQCRTVTCYARCVRSGHWVLRPASAKSCGCASPRSRSLRVEPTWAKASPPMFRPWPMHRLRATLRGRISAPVVHSTPVFLCRAMVQALLLGPSFCLSSAMRPRAA